MSVKDCADHWYLHRSKLFRRLSAAVLIFVILVLLAVLIVWLVLRPSKPKFYLQDASISQLNLSAGGANLLTIVMQVTLSSRNPNDRISVYYDRLDAFAAYKGQQITAATALSTGYQGHNEVVVWPPYLYGSVPMAPYLADSLDQDRTAGLLLVYVKVEGRLRWKVGTWISGHYHLEVKCPAFFTIDDGKGSGGTLSFHFQQISSCSVDV